ncbi:MAG: DUF2333 family protein [Rhizobiaceae bacterium]|nr:DUF2333 family protein [Rhizobiaceae bacterium]
MLDPVVAAIKDMFAFFGRSIAKLFAWLIWPFVWVSGWYSKRGWILRGVVGALFLGWLISYGYFFWQTQRWSGFDPDYVAAYDFGGNQTEPGEPISSTVGSDSVCGRSSIIKVSRDLIDYNVNRNVWIPSMLMTKLGFFGMDWKRTPYFDNKEAFQRGINEGLRRASRQFVDTLGRVRGTSRIDPDLQTAREKLNYPEDAWYISWKGPQVTTPTRYREAMDSLDAFNVSLSKCEAQFDVRADNLQKFLDEIASAIGSTSDILRGRMEESNAGWFDPRADDRFWFAYGQLYAYYGMLAAARSDFKSVSQERNLTRIWDRALEQLQAALGIQPVIISNGGEASWIMPSHLATMGFYLLRVRANLTEMRDVLRN